MKFVLVVSMAAVLGMGISGKAEAHGYPASGGSIYWADENVVIGLNYGGPYVVPNYVPPRYGYAPRRYGHYHGGKYCDHYHGRHKGYSKGYRSGYSKGYKKGHRHGHRGHDRRRRHWDD